MTEPCYDDCPLACRPRLTALGIAAIVLLRLAAGWHFWSEGTKKFVVATDGTVALAPEFQRATTGFLKGAVGPWADFFHSQAPGDHRADELLAVPTQLPQDRAIEIASWANGYAARRAAAAAAKKPPLPAEFPEVAPYFPWASQIVADFKATADRVGKVGGLNEAGRSQAKELLEGRLRQLAEYLSGEAIEIAEWQHELWRLKNWNETDEAASLPFKAERIAAKRAETTAAGRLWPMQVAGIERGLRDDLVSISRNADGKIDGALRDALAGAADDPRAVAFERTNWVIASLVAGVGLCLLLGLFTRLAALGGIAFLLSVVAAQPPWVAGAQPVYYQVVEAAALLVLVATAAGRFFGIDFFIHAAWRRMTAR